MEKNSFVGNIREYIPNNLNPKEHQGYYTFDCKYCCHGSAGSKKQTMYIYKNGCQAFCNRRNNCTWQPYVWELGVKTIKDIQGYHYGQTTEERKTLMSSSSMGYGPKGHKNIELEAKLAQTPEFYQHRHSKFMEMFGNLDSQVDDYLNRRIPNGSRLYIEGAVGSTRNIYYLNKKQINTRYTLGYGMVTPLWNIPFGLITNAQTRYIGNKKEPPLKDKNGKPLKTLSFRMKGGYGPGGATFGCLKNVLATEAMRAKKENRRSVLIVAEGDVDYLTILGSRLENVVGVPGCGQATKIIEYLQKIKWEGDLVLSLDGDDAGQRAIDQALKNYTEEDTFKVFNARCGTHDINDIYNTMGGAEAIRRVISSARPVKLRRDQKLKKDQPAVFKQLMKANLYVKMRHMSGQAKDRLRLILKMSSQKGEKSPISSLGRAVNCGNICETHMEYHEGKEFPIVGCRKKRVAESGACLHCCIAQWNCFIGKKLLDEWPEKLFYVTVPFEEGNIEDAKRQKKRILRDCTIPPEARASYEEKGYGKSLAIFIDVLRSHLVVVSGAQNQNDIILQRLRSFRGLEDKKREDILENFVLPAYLSYAEYVASECGDLENNLIDDEILTTSFERYYSREGLQFPTQKEAREGVREFVKSLREEDEKKDEESSSSGEGSGEGDPTLVDEKEEELNSTLKYKIVATYRHRGGGFQKLIGLSYRSLSFHNITRRDVFGKEMNFDPSDETACNFLEHPKLAPKPIDEIINDFYWLEFGHPVNMPEDMRIPGFYGVQIDKVNVKKRKDYGDLEYWSRYSAWDNAGWDPNIFTFMPGDMSLKEFEYRLEKDEWEDHMVREEYKDPPDYTKDDPYTKR